MIWLVVFWLSLNLIDIIVSRMATQAGMIEIGTLYLITKNFWLASILKLSLAVLIATVLAYYQKKEILIGLSLGMLLIVLWNIFALNAYT